MDFFLRFEADLDFSRPSFSEIKVQIKRPIDGENIQFQYSVSGSNL